MSSTRARGSRATGAINSNASPKTARARRLAAEGDFEASWRNRLAWRAERERPRGGVSGDEFARLGRAANPLHRAGVDAELRGDLAHARPSRSRQSLPDPLF
jgi:hypothetical protein